MYSDRLFLQALVMMIVRHLHKVHELPSRARTTNRRHAHAATPVDRAGTLPVTSYPGTPLESTPGDAPCPNWLSGSPFGGPDSTVADVWAIDSTILRARGGVWHQKHREKGEIPHSSLDPEAHWTKSGWHGWVYGWKLHIVSVVAAVWFPIAAVLTPANVADSDPAPDLLGEVPAEVRFVLGDLSTTPFPTYAAVVHCRIGS